MESSKNIKTLNIKNIDDFEKYVVAIGLLRMLKTFFEKSDISILSIHF